MKFYDEADIAIQSGRGGDGLITWRREKWVPWWGPSWWDGWAGGSVFFVADENEYTLLPLRYRKVWKAKHGANGQSRDKYGAAGDDIRVKVPLWTLVSDKDTGEVLAHLTEHMQDVCLAKWGIGGKWNIHFKNATNQFPNIALHGEPGQKRNLHVELQLLWDIALIWTPSVGKSTLINSISNVKAKTASYEFTTLVPNLGIIEHKGKSFAMIDIPWLIAGASEGKWLGNMFLRHVLKARAWVIMLDAAKDLPWIADRWLLLDEIKEYVEQKYEHLDEEILHRCTPGKNNVLLYEAYIVTEDTDEVSWEETEWELPPSNEKVLLTKAIVTVVNKFDMLDDELWWEYRKELLVHMSEYLWEKNKDILTDAIMTLSALTKVHVDTFLDRCLTIVTDSKLSSIAHYDIGSVTYHDPSPYATQVTDELLPFLLEEWYVQEDKVKKKNVWEVWHPKIAYFTFVLPWGNDEAEMWYRQTMAREQFLYWFEKQWIKQWDILKIRSPYIWTDDRFIMRDYSLHE